jgi:integrase
MTRGGRRHFGSVRKLPSGRWQASYWHEGTRHVAPATLPTKGDALAFLAEMETELARGSWIDPSGGQLTFGELADRWLRSNPAKRSSSWARDDAILRNHLRPVLGEVPIASVSKANVQQLVNEWTARAAPRTVRRQYEVIRAVFAYAVANDLLQRSPCRAVRLPAPERGRRRVLTPAHVASIAAATPEPYRAMVWIGAVLGLRWGEVAGLQMGSVDVRQGVVTVLGQLGRDGALGPPKSDAGRRSLSMPEALAELIEQHVAGRAIGDDPESLLFVSPEGAPLDYTNWRRRVWLPAVAAAGIPEVGFHDLRRAAATALVVERVDLKTAQTRLGHSDPRLTLAIYAQATTEADRDAAEKLGERFFGAR